MKIKYQGIYKIRNLLNGKVYIGQSIDITKRFKDHKNLHKKDKNHYLYRAFNKYGLENFEFNVIEHINDINKLNEHEQYWMDFYKSYNSEFGYNLRPKAESNRGYKHTDETKEKMSKSKIGKIVSKETRLKLSLASKGKLKSEEHTRKNSESHKGKKQSEETIKKRIDSRKSYKHSEETRKKISEANIGKVHSQETIEKIKLGCIKRSKNPEYIKRLSDAHKGQVPWITGKKHKKESIEKMSESHKLQKRKPHTEETKLKMSISGKGKNKGVIRTKEHKELLSLLYKGKKRSKEITEKIILTKSKQDCSHSIETKRKIAEANKKLCEDPEYVKKIVSRFKIKKVLV